jgi:asparagine synthase (glutamine-hydrolysing)
MPGIVGIVSSRPRDNIERELLRMIDSVRHFDWYKTEQFASPQRNFAVGHVHLNIFPTEHSPHSWLHGEETDAFTRVEYDEPTQTLTILNDRFGMMPLFYTVADNALIFGTEMKAVLAHAAVPRKTDERGVADLLAFGMCLGEKTLVRGVKCLPGGAKLRFDARAEQLKLERTWDFRQHIGRGRGGNLDDIARAFQRAVESRCSTGQIGVSLSGGYDSRTIIAAIDHQRHRVQTLTLDVADGADQIIAEQIARVTNGLPNHHFIENSSDFFAKWPQYVREMVWLTDGLFFDEACVMMSTLDTYRELGIQVALRGHGGELARMQWAYELTCNRLVLSCRTQAELKAQLLRQLNFGLPAGEPARTSLEEAFAGIEPSCHPLDQVTCLYAQEYLRRQSAPSLAELRSRVEVRLPFLDAEYIDAVMQLAPQERLGTGVHRHMLARFNPALLQITNANTGAPAGASDFVQRLYRKVNGLLKRYFGYERFKHYVDIAAWLQAPLRHPVEDVLLDARTLDRGLYRADTIRNLRSPEATLLLLYLELWQRMFIDGESWK